MKMSIDFKHIPSNFLRKLCLYFSNFSGATGRSGQRKRKTEENIRFSFTTCKICVKIILIIGKNNKGV